MFLALEGTDPTVSENTTRPTLAINVDGVTNAAGLVVHGAPRAESDGVVSVHYVIRRTLGARGWVLAMMAIYWALTLGAAAVTALVIRRKRMWEGRMLAWLGAMLFALVTFRAAAPGSPPVGTFLDYFAVFEAVGVVAVSLAVLIVYYLVQPPEMLNLTPPQDDRR